MRTVQFWSGLGLTVVLLLSLTGCNGAQRVDTETFLQTGIPGEEYRVGGGYQIRYIAPEEGIVYLVENRTRTLLGTESLRRNDVFEFFPTTQVVEAFRRVDIELSEGEFVIYFVPATKLYQR